MENDRQEVLTALDYVRRCPPNSPLRRVGWITLLVLGLVTLVGGGLMGAFLSLALGAMISLSASPPGWGAYALIVTFPGVPVLFGIGELWCSLLIRGRSRAALIVAAGIVGMQITLLAWLLTTAADWMTLLVTLLIIGVILCGMEVMLVALMVEQRRQT